jgi:ABC-2 type transport system permease protein
VKKNRLFDSLSTSKFRHGGYAALLILAAVVIVVVINLLVDQIPWKADLSENKLFTLSDQTKKIVSGLNTDITIATLAKVGQDNAMIKEALQKYARLSKHIKLETIDPDRNPAWSKKYSTTGSSLQAGSIIVVGPKRFKAISPYDMYDVDYQSNPNQPQVTGFTVEKRVTSAIQYVTVDRNPVVYQLQGQGETSLSVTGLQTEVENDNYQVKDLNLLTEGSVPADTDLLLVVDPRSDLTAQEADKIRSYLEGGGRALFAIGIQQPGLPFPNLDGLLKSYGVSIQRLLIVEGDASRHLQNNPIYLLPKLGAHDILTPLSTNDLPVLMPISMGIETLALKKKTTSVEPLLTTSQNSWGKVDYGKADLAPEKEKGDVEGPFAVAVAITDTPTNPNAKDTRLVVTGCSAFMSSDVLSVDPSNTDFFINSLRWLRDQKDTISIQSKSLYNMPLRLNQTTGLILSGIVVILMPLLVLGGGFVVWMRRRHL